MPVPLSRRSAIQEQCQDARASISAYILELIPPPPKQILFGNHYQPATAPALVRQRISV
jgi:hypothetical protein